MEEKRKRGRQVNIRVSEEELTAIEKKMGQAGIKNREAYLRKMALDGYVVRIDLKEVRELSTLLRRYGNNLNQIAARMNLTGDVYEKDMGYILRIQEKLWEGMKEVLARLSSLS